MYMMWDVCLKFKIHDLPAVTADHMTQIINKHSDSIIYNLPCNNAKTVAYIFTIVSFNYDFHFNSSKNSQPFNT